MLEAKEQDLCFFKRFVLLASNSWFFYIEVLKFSQDGEINVIFNDCCFFFFLIKFSLTLVFPCNLFSFYY
jgi:hypothetical protein